VLGTQRRTDDDEVIGGESQLAYCGFST